MNILDKDYKMKVTPEQSRAVQEACFAHGIYCQGSRAKVVAYLDKPYLYIRASGTITFGGGDEEEFFDSAKFCPIEPESIIATLNNKPKSHPHAALMAQYAEDAAETNAPWERWEIFIAADEYGDDRWVTCNRPITWETQKQYRRKSDTIKVGKHKFPRPIQTAPNIDQEYFYVEFSPENQLAEPGDGTWKGYDFELSLLKSSRCHLTEKDCQQHADVLNAINRGDVE